MNIKTELLKRYISDFINNRIEDFDIDANLIADSTAIAMLKEIQEIIKNENLTDFEALDEIICIFARHKIDCGDRHDFI